MQAQVQVFLLNYEYSQSYADENFDGKESADNRKMDWEDELVINELSGAHSFKDASTYVLQGMKNEAPFAEEIPNMMCWEFNTNKGENVVIACSKEIVEEHHFEENEKGFVLKVYLKSDEPLSNPIPGVYIAAKSFPESLIDA